MKLSVVDDETRVTQLRQEMTGQSARFESAPAGSIVAWAVERFGTRLALACSFQEVVLIDIAVKVDPRIEVVFLDTGSHFPETLEYVETVRARYDLNLTVTTPVAGSEDHPCGTPLCCEFRKVRPLKAALVGKDAWLTGLKRVDAPTRRSAPVVARSPHPSAAGQGVPLHRLRAHHASGGRGRGSPGRPLVRLRQGRVRTARLA